jgi:hypothetical protein
MVTCGPELHGCHGAYQTLEPGEDVQHIIPGRPAVKPETGRELSPITPKHRQTRNVLIDRVSKMPIKGCKTPGIAPLRGSERPTLDA